MGDLALEYRDMLSSLIMATYIQGELLVTTPHDPSNTTVHSVQSVQANTPRYYRVL